jgi:hypothetical protein
MIFFRPRKLTGMTASFLKAVTQAGLPVTAG